VCTFFLLSFADENTLSSGRNIPWRSFCRFCLLWMQSSQPISFISLNWNISPKDGHKINLKNRSTWSPAFWQCLKKFSPKSVLCSLGGDVKCLSVLKKVAWTGEFDIWRGLSLLALQYKRYLIWQTLCLWYALHPAWRGRYVFGR
jgi:hypothetical protein